MGWTNSDTHTMNHAMTFHVVFCAESQITRYQNRPAHLAGATVSGLGITHVMEHGGRSFWTDDVIKRT